MQQQVGFDDLGENHRVNRLIDENTVASRSHPGVMTRHRQKLLKVLPEVQMSFVFSSEEPVSLSLMIPDRSSVSAGSYRHHLTGPGGSSAPLRSVILPCHG